MTATQTVTRNTVYSRKIAEIQTWEDAINIGVMCVEERDKWSWALGELASHIRTSTLAGGRPVGGDRQGTLSAFADAIGMRRESVSAMCWNWEFFQEMRDDLPQNVTWHQLSEARRRSGWRPGMSITPEFQGRAKEFAEEYADGGRPKRTPMTLSNKLRVIDDELQTASNHPQAESVKDMLEAARYEISVALERLGNA